MATRMELPTKREYSGEKEKEQEASKKAKREEEAGSVDEIMSDSFAEEEAQREEWRLIKAKMEEVSKEAMRKEEEEEKVKEQLRSKCRALEYKIYFRAYVDPNRADGISSEDDALRLFTAEDREMFLNKTFRKNWHMRPTPDDLDEYQRLAVYYSEDDPFYAYAHSFYYSYEFDCNYQKFTREINKTIKWDTTLSDARATAEKIWKNYIPDDVDTMLLEESIFHAISVGCDIQKGKELALLFVDIFRREAAGEGFVQALAEIVKEQGFGCYPLTKVLIEKALKEEKKGEVLILYNIGLKRDMEEFIDIQSGKISPEDDSRVKDLICDHFWKLPLEATGYDYIDYIKKKNSVARELKILKDDQVLE
ncbi:hypothetical protein FCM35_KLT09781 [Carex littledalei]|uniref:Uncharacterized protein n=1 Tax=Carex littledalei TaxID=544730 RepID=A0A833RHF4_9POAL|nr:hypothetical protein FCM35_KLT09781 [Carex littledalei]